MSRTIATQGTVGIRLDTPSDNPVTVTSGAGITTSGAYALYGTSVARWSIINDGTLQAARYGITLAAGGSVINGSATLPTALIYGYAGVAITGGGTVANHGSIIGIQNGIDLRGGGLVTNSGNILGSFSAGVYVSGGSGTVRSSGLISGTNFGVLLESGGTVVGQPGGSITGEYGGVVVYGGLGFVTNDGAIGAQRGIGVALNDGGSVINGSARHAEALIGGSLFGEAVAISGGAGTLINDGMIGGSVDMTADGTVKNAGTISGQVLLGGDRDRVSVVPGAVFEGGVTASGQSVLELAPGAAAGTFGGIGTVFAGFDTVMLDPQAEWSLTGMNALPPHATLRLGAGSGLEVTGMLQAGRELLLPGSGTLTIAKQGSVEIGMAGGAAPGKLTVDAGATLWANGEIRSAVVDHGLVEAYTTAGAPGELAVTGNVFGAGTIAVGVGEVFWAGGSLTPALQFTDTPGDGVSTVALARAGEVSSVFSGFEPGDTIDLPGQIVTKISFASATGILTAKDGAATVAMLHFAGSDTTQTFAFGSDGHGGTNITAR